MSIDATPTPALRTLPWALLLYAAATLLHFAHNAEYLPQYPNLPASWSASEVYLAWCALTLIGIVGYRAYRSGHRHGGAALLACYGALGFAGFLHYTRAPMLQHSVIMNLTIWTEAAAAALLLINIAALRPRRAGAVGGAPHA
jgi:hypothetical protein